MSGSLAPTQAGFLAFVRGTMGIPTQVLANDNPAIAMSFGVAMEIVNQAFISISPMIYQLAVYNLAGDLLINFARDINDEDYFVRMREELGIVDFIPGVLSASSDQGTSETMLNPDFMRGLTLQNLQNLKTVYGRRYLAFAQSFGGHFAMV